MGIKQSVSSERREQVRRWMAERDTTGESWRSIAERTGINYATLTGWAWRLRREQRAASQPTHKRIEFVEVLSRDGAEPAREPEHDGRVEIVLRGDRRLRIGAQFDAATLTRLVRALEAC